MKRIRGAGAGLLMASVIAASNAWAGEGLRRFEVNAEESTITASVAEPMAMIRGDAVGAFRITGGEVLGDPADLARTGRVELVIDAASYQSGSDGRDQDVKENALEVAKFPTIAFESTGLTVVEKSGEASGEIRLQGMLSLHGVTREITLPVVVRLEGGRLFADGTYAFEFEEYGVKRPSKMMGMMTTGDVATIEFHVVADPA